MTDFDDELHEALAAAVADAEPVPSPNKPMQVAEHLLHHYQYDELTTLLHWRGSWTQWQQTHWVETEEATIRAWVYGRLKDAVYLKMVIKKGKDDDGKPFEDETWITEPWNPNRHKVANVLEAIRASVHLSETIDTPSWLDCGPHGPRSEHCKYRGDEIVACSNGLLHVGTRKLLDLTPLYFNRVAVPFGYEPAAPEPTRWLQFLDQLWPDDPDSIAALQEFFGYVLSGRTDLHKIMLLIGPTRSGKGTIARVLGALLGKGNVAGPTLASLGTNFGLSPLLGKPLAVVSDARLAGGNVHQVVERLLSISGEDLLTVDRKFKEPWSGKLPSRFLILSNELPRFGDASGAIANRFVVLAMSESFLGRENTSLTEELTAELTGILSWSLDGLDRLAQQGRFTEPQASRDSIVALQDLVSPVSAFVRDRCEKGGHEVSIPTLFSAWKDWCEDNGHKPGSAQTFGRDLRAVIPQLRVIRPRDDGDRERRYFGLKLRDSTMHRTADHRGPEPDSGPLVRSGPRSNPLSAQINNNNLPGRCTVCGEPLATAVIADGFNTHPTCGE